MTYCYQIGTVALLKKIQFLTGTKLKFSLVWYIVYGISCTYKHTQNPVVGCLQLDMNKYLHGNYHTATAAKLIFPTAKSRH